MILLVQFFREHMARISAAARHPRFDAVLKLESVICVSLDRMIVYAWHTFGRTILHQFHHNIAATLVALVPIERDVFVRLAIQMLLERPVQQYSFQRLSWR